MKTVAETRILIVPLDWGLGHATRCIPVIRELLRQNCTIFIAGEGKTQALLQQEFPHVQSIPLNGYRVHYAKKRWVLWGRIFFQIPKIFSSILYENRWLKNIVEQYKIDAVISDNRYGLYHQKILSVFITHQLHIKTPFTCTDFLLQKINYRLINRFDECWIPDYFNEPNLAGQLSHPQKMPSVPVRYIGPLSRFQLIQPSFGSKHLLVLLSGPEPQRTLLENLVLAQLRNYTQPVIFVRGLPGETHVPLVPANVSIMNHLPAAALQEVILQATTVISRCGYSTVMDVMSLQKKSILIPTPGQTEQEYLAEHLMKNRLALCLQQEKFNLQAALTLAESFPYRFYVGSSPADLKEAVEQLIGRAKRKMETGNGQ